MLYNILSEVISILGTVISVLVVRWLMELASPSEDIRAARRFLWRIQEQWRRGSFRSVVIYFRVRKLLDYDA